MNGADQLDLLAEVADAVDRARDDRRALGHTEPRSHRDDPQTSVDAAELAAPAAGSHRRQIIDLYARDRAGYRWLGYTADEVDHLLDLPPYAAQRRTTDLVRDGWLEPTGHTRPTRAGAPARVLRLTDAGRCALEAES